MSERARDFFQTDVESYDRAHYGAGVRSFMSVRLECLLEVVDALHLPEGARVVEGGCGPGYLVQELLKRGFDVAALDASRGMLDLTRRRVEGMPGDCFADLLLASIEQLPWADGTFDLATTCGVIEYLREDGPTLREMWRVLKPGGYLLLPVTNGASPMFALDFLIEAIKRQPALLRPFNALWTRLGHTPLRPRHFVVRRHSPSRLQAEMKRVGFEVVDGLYFHFIPWPRPLDALLPGLTARIGERMEKMGRGRLGPIADGYLVVARKKAPSNRTD